MTTQALWEAARGPTACHLSFDDGQTLVADLESAAGGLGAPTPHDLLDAALAACTTLTLELYVARKHMAVQSLRVEVTHESVAGKNTMTRTLHVVGTLSDEERAGLLRVADVCPVHKTLTAGSAISTVADIQAPG